MFLGIHRGQDLETGFPREGKSDLSNRIPKKPWAAENDNRQDFTLQRSGIQC